MKRVFYYVLFGLWYILSLLPMRVLYVVSDGLFYLIYYVVKYRRPLVRKNLSDSFPEKSGQEIIRIEKGFYSWFCDYIVETIKLFSMSERQIKRRMRFVGMEKVSEYVKQGRSCSLYLGHYCNWEWVTSIPLSMDGDVLCGQIYHVLENPMFDKLFYRLRGRMGAVSIPMAETLRYIVRYRNEGKPVMIGFIADQTPFWNNIHYWTDFLNHDTPVLTGTERITRKADFVAFYLDLRRERRGYYVGEFKLLSDAPKELPEYELTERYWRALEATIRRQPHLWLWTHNRWKRTREEWEWRIDPVTKKMNLN